MRIRLFLYLLLALPSAAIADADDGQFMGFELGTQHPVVPQETMVSTAGNLRITAINPTKPADIVQVNLITTPESRTIGHIVAISWFTAESEARDFGSRYMLLLRAKYPEWNFGEDKMDENFDLVEVNLDKAPHNIKLNLGRDERDGRNMWRVSLTLGWDRESKQWSAWQKQATSEQTAARASEHEKLMDNSDIRGL